jgi:hypothetical protein
VGFDPGQIRHQQGEGLGRPLLAPPQARHRPGIAGIDQQLEAAHPLQGEDLPLGEQGRRRRDQGVAGGRGLVALAWHGRGGDRPGLASGIEQAQLRAAGRAADRFGMEAAVGRIGELLGTGRAGREARLGGVGALPGFGGRDRIARTAVAAGKKRVAVAAPARIVELIQAGAAGGAVGR